MRSKKKKLKITVKRPKGEQKDEDVIFDAVRDNQEKGIKAKDLIRVLKKTL